MTNTLFPSAGHTPTELAAAVRRLADDLALLATGASPTAEMLADAPVLDRWRPGLRRAGCLVGVVGGHPRIATGHSTITTELYAIDGDGLWARTFSKFYLLGRTGDAGGSQQ